MKRRELLKYAAALGSAAVLGQQLALPTGAAAENNGSGVAQESLRDLAASRGLVFGAAIRQKHLVTDQPYADIVGTQCGILTPELELKWEALRPQPDTYDFSGADWLYEFTKSHGMLFQWPHACLGGPLCLRGLPAPLTPAMQRNSCWITSPRSPAVTPRNRFMGRGE